MTVLYILSSTLLLGGATKSFLALLDELKGTDVVPIVVVPDNNGVTSVLRGKGIETIVIPYSSSVWPLYSTLRQKITFTPHVIINGFSNGLAGWRLSKKLSGRKIDLIHVNCSVVGCFHGFARKNNIPILYHFREYGDKDFGMKYIPTNQEYHKRFHESNVYSICITKDIQRHHHLDQSDTSIVVYNGIIGKSDHWNKNHKERNSLLFAGRIEEAKGVMELLQAYNEYAHAVEQPLPLQLAGTCIDPNYFDRLSKYIAQEHLEDSVTFLGEVSDMPSLYQSAKAIFISSRFEGFGRCMPEAMSYGCIAVGNDTGGTKEQLDNGLEFCGEEIGLRYRTQEELVDAMFRIHNLSDSDADQLRQHAFDTVNALYSNKTYAHQIQTFYKQILNKD